MCCRSASIAEFRVLQFGPASSSGLRLVRASLTAVNTKQIGNNLLSLAATPYFQHLVFPRCPHWNGSDPHHSFVGKCRAPGENWNRC
jgi:hypothetical protein